VVCRIWVGCGPVGSRFNDFRQGQSKRHELFRSVGARLAREGCGTGSEDMSDVRASLRVSLAPAKPDLHSQTHPPIVAPSLQFSDRVWSPFNSAQRQSTYRSREAREMYLWQLCVGRLRVCRLLLSG
jgi:hypothetical protein